MVNHNQISGGIEFDGHLKKFSLDSQFPAAIFAMFVICLHVTRQLGITLTSEEFFSVKIGAC